MHPELWEFLDAAEQDAERQMLELGLSRQVNLCGLPLVCVAARIHA